MNGVNTRIQTRLTVALAGLVVVTILILGLASYWQAKSALSESVDETAFALAEQYGMQTQFFTEEAILRLEDLASVDLLRDSGDMAMIAPVLAENQK